MNPRIKELSEHARATAAMASPPGLGAHSATAIGRALSKALSDQFSIIRSEPPVQTAEAVRQRLYAAWDNATSDVRNEVPSIATRKSVRPN
ncbi:hypothetical protein [Hydrogenophaga sp. 2FB]|uniref:hypothetical protein n=1 Tax=Hydrogenophaga sp. 2FB TaxID=2502187 RepID=UPI0010F5D15C|nr:hypothetical protein [Hydrogenophaga sp. 2FB]